MQSVDAQKQLALLNLGGKDIDIDDVLDDVEDNRIETRELTDRLGSLGGIDDPLEEQPFDANAVMAAMGIRTDYKEDILVQECKAMMQDHWQPDMPHAAPAASIFSSDSQYNTNTSVDNIRQRNTAHASHLTHARNYKNYELPQVPGSHSTHHQEEAEVAAMRNAALAPPRIEY